jgi:hypothetical protein
MVNSISLKLSCCGDKLEKCHGHLHDGIFFLLFLRESEISAPNNLFAYPWVCVLTSRLAELELHAGRLLLVPDQLIKVLMHL